MAAEIRELIERVEALTAERDEALAWIAAATRMITEVVGGGSELFIRKGKVFRADLEYCKTRLRERQRTAHEQLLRAVKERNEAQALRSREASQ